MKKRKLRTSIATRRAASLKGARTKRRMQMEEKERKELIAEYINLLRNRYSSVDLLPEVKWP